MVALHRASRVLLGCYLAVAVLELVASTQHGRGWGVLDAACLVLLVPLLGAFLVRARLRRDRLTGWVLVALGFSWLGDTVGGLALIAKIGLFVLAQLAYAVAFWPYRRRGLLRRPVGLAVFVAGLAGLAVLVGRGSGPLLPAIVGYAAALGTMAVLASGVDRVAAVGGIVFLVSDLSLGLTVFAEAGGAVGSLLDLLVMPTYVAAQLMLVWGVLRVQRSEFPAPMADPSDASVGLGAAR